MAKMIKVYKMVQDKNWLCPDCGAWIEGKVINYDLCGNTEKGEVVKEVGNGNCENCGAFKRLFPIEYYI